MSSVALVNMGLSMAQQHALEFVVRDGFLLNDGGQYRPACGRAVAHGTVRSLLQRGFLAPNTDSLLPGTEPQTLILGPQLIGRGGKQPPEGRPRARGSQSEKLIRGAANLNWRDA